MPKSLETMIVTAADAGVRLDAYLRAKLPEQSRAGIADLVAAKLVLVNRRAASKGQLLQVGDEVQLSAAARNRGAAADAELALDVLYEDEHLVAVNKPAGVPSHALRAGETGNIASALLARYPQMGEVGFRALEPGLLHRLDTDTSGILLAAKSTAAFDALHAMHARGELDKQYIALCAGHVLAPQELHGYLDASTRKVRVTQAPWGHARAVSLRVLESVSLSSGARSLVTVSAAFAARHQVRAQLAAVGHPIVGDALYGGETLEGLTHHLLHASRVAFRHPLLQRTLEVHAPLPAEWGEYAPALQDTPK